MRKDFDGPGWAANHDDDFKQLISSARATREGPNGATRVTTGKSHHTASKIPFGSDSLPSSRQNLDRPEKSQVLDQSSNTTENQIYEQYSRLSRTRDNLDLILGSDKRVTLLPGAMTEVGTGRLSR